MPEVGIGFFPDVGASHLLPDLGGSFGMYLGPDRQPHPLWRRAVVGPGHAHDQGARTRPACSSGWLRDRRRRNWRCAAFSVAGPARDGQADAGSHRPPFRAAVAERHHRQPGARRTRTTSSRPRRWRRSARARRPACTSPSAQISAGLTLSMDECMRMEFRILNRMLEGHDFYEGIRAAIIDKGDDAAMAAGRRSTRSSAADVDALFRAARRTGTRAVSEVTSRQRRAPSPRRSRSSSPGSTA